MVRWTVALFFMGAVACGGPSFSVESPTKGPLDAVSIGSETIDGGGESLEEASALTVDAADAAVEARAAEVDSGPSAKEGSAPMYVVGVVIPSTENGNPGDARQGKCCIPDTVTPPVGQLACATTLCEANCIPIVCGTCPSLADPGNAFTVVCPAP
jgi:hypothetical protein